MLFDPDSAMKEFAIMSVYDECEFNDKIYTQELNFYHAKFISVDISLVPN